MLEALLTCFDLYQMPGRGLVVDDGSPDYTGELAEPASLRDPRVAVLRFAEKEGIGPTYHAGFGMPGRSRPIVVSEVAPRTQIEWAGPSPTGVLAAGHAVSGGSACQLSHVWPAPGKGLSG